MKKEHVNEIKGILVLACGLILFASFSSFIPTDLPWYTSSPNVPAHNLIRIVGAYIAGLFLFVFGYSSYFFVVFLFFWSWNKLSGRDIEFTWAKFTSSLVLFCVISSLFSMTGPQMGAMRFQRAGLVGFMTADLLVKYLGWIGAYIVLFTLGILTLILTGEFLVSPILFKFVEWLQGFLLEVKERLAEYQQRFFAERKTSTARARKSIPRRSTKVEEEEEEEEYEEEEEDDEESSQPNIRIARPTPASAASSKPKVVGEYIIPTLDLLKDPPQISNSQLENDLTDGARILEATLLDFNVRVRVADIERGPVITRYELEPAPGVKVQKITALSDDIALAMRVAAVRIVAPIPGKNAVGVEVPNSKPSHPFSKNCWIFIYSDRDRRLTFCWI